jgi:hypothetical protein
MKISTSHLKRILHEELFYREFHRKTEELTEVHSEKQRNYMCAMKDSDDRPEGLSKAEAEEMCSGPMKEAEASDPYGYETAAAAEREAYKKGPPHPSSNKTVAGTQNLDWLDPENPDPEAEFFGQKIDPDDVGTQTMHFTPDQLKRLRELMSRKQ